MMTIKTMAKASPIAGTGLFADEFVPKGAIVWKFIPGLDSAFTKTEVEDLSEPHRSEILGLEHAYISKQTGRYVDCGDDAKYVNHSDTPNITAQSGEEEEDCIAIRDIQKGEEITQDYREFDEVFTHHW